MISAVIDLQSSNISVKSYVVNIFMTSGIYIITFLNTYKVIAIRIVYIGLIQLYSLDMLIFRKEKILKT